MTFNGPYIIKQVQYNETIPMRPLPETIGMPMSPFPQLESLASFTTLFSHCAKGNSDTSPVKQKSSELQEHEWCWLFAKICHRCVGTLCKVVSYPPLIPISLHPMKSLHFNISCVVLTVIEDWCWTGCNKMEASRCLRWSCSSLRGKSVSLWKL